MNMENNQGEETLIQPVDSSSNISHRGTAEQAKIIAFPSYEEAQPVPAKAGFADFLKVLGKYKNTILLSVLATLALSALIASLITPVYRSTAALKINAHSAKVLDYDVEVDKNNKPDRDYYQAEFKLLKSREVLARTIKDLNLEQDLRELTEQVSLLQRARQLFAKWIGMADITNTKTKPLELALADRITAIPSKDWGLVDLSVEWETADGAAAIANSIANNFIQVSLDKRLQLAQATRDSLNRKLSESKQKLQDSELKLAAYSKQQKLIHIDGEKSLSSSKLEALSEAYINAQQERIAAENAYKQQFASSGSMRTLDNKVIENLKVKLASLQSKYQEQLEVYKANYPGMVQLKQQINKTKSQLEHEIANIKSSVNSDLKNRYVTAKKNEERLKEQLEEGKKQLTTFQTKNIGYNRLLREVETNKKIYEGLLQRVKEITVVEDIGTSHISLIEPAYPAFKHYKPNIPVIMGFGLLSGLLIGISLAFQFNSNDNRIHNVDDLSEISDIPVLGVFPFVKRKDLALLQNEEHEPSVSEAFRSLRTKLNFLRKSGIPKIIHITSSEPNEGKSSTAINLASVIEESGKRVLLVDADLRIPSLHTYLGLENLNGLSEFLSGLVTLKDVIQRVDNSNLYVLTAGLNDEKSADLLSSDKMLKFLHLASQKFDHIIIDSPPVLGFADALILANRAKCTLFVVSNDRIDKKFIMDTLKNLELSYANVIGFILTKATDKAQGHYGYNKYYDYSYAKKLSAG